jgi:lysozyme family protein
MTFDEAFDRLLGHEGGYVFDARDPGGETNWGVTARVARASGYHGDMRQLPRDTAKAIYHAAYWLPIQADELPEEIRFDIFDAAVNSGVSQATRWLQRAVGAKPDGVIGPLTMAAIHRKNGLKLAVGFNAERLQFMTDLAGWQYFSRGWARRIASNLKALA